MDSAQSSKYQSIYELFNQEPLKPLDPITDTDQIKFEQLLTVLVLIEQFGTHGFFGSSKKKDISLSSLSREFVKNRIQTISISTEHVDKVRTLLPDRLIQNLHIPIVLPFDQAKDFEANSEYYLAMVEEKIEFFKLLSQDEITDDIIKSVTSSYIIGNNELIMFLSTDEKLLDSYSSDKFKKNKDLTTFESKITYLKSLDKFGIHSAIQYLSLIKILKEKLCSDITFARNHIYQLIQNLTKENFSDSIFKKTYFWRTDKVRYSSTNNKSDEENDENNDEDQDDDNLIVSSLKSIEKIHEEKYYREVYSKAHPEKVKYDYYLNFADYWTLFQLDPVLVTEIIEYSFLVDDYTFSEYKYSWDFLDSLNPRVKQNIITKHNSDRDRVLENRYGLIASLEDLVDIAIFCQFPPTFLRPENDGTEYYDENAQVLFKLLESYGWNMNKLDYLNWDLVISYNLVRK